MYRKYPKYTVMGIIAIVSVIIMLLFLCYKILIFEERILYLENALNLKLEEIVDLSNSIIDMENTQFEEIKSMQATYSVSEIEMKPTLQVYITGEVKNPGIYEIKEGSRINDIISAAGGLTSEAAVQSINLAGYVYDTAHIIIPKYGQEPVATIDVFANKNETALPAQSNSTYEKPAYSGIVNINTADKTALMSLPGIGEVTAQNIIDYRSKNGNFKSIEQIKNVSRIGDSTFNNIADKISVE